MDIISTVVLLCGSIISTCFITLSFMHMFQLNSYKPKVQLAWCRKNSRRFAPFIIDAAACAAAILINSNTGIFILAGAFILTGLFFLPNKKAKKPLVITARVKRMLVSACLLYAVVSVIALLFLLKEGTLVNVRILTIIYFILHIISPFGVLIANFVNKPIEKAINQHYINDAKRILAQCDRLTVIGVTGSYGKTSVKFYLNTLLRAKYNVLVTPESYNTPMGVVKTVRGSLKSTHDIFVCEMGAKNVGDIKELCDIVHPVHGVITSVGPQHLESFRTLDNVIKTKFELADSLPGEGMLFLNGDDENIKTQLDRRANVTYGLGENNDYSAFDLSVSEKGTSFSVKAPDGETETFTTKLIGRHNVINILGAIAVSNKMGISLHDLKPQVRKLENVPHRLQLIDRGETLIIDDAYNSNPNGSRVALETLALFNGKKILVTPGMIELGDKEDEYNREFGRNASAVCDYVVLVGEKQTKSIHAGLKDRDYPDDKIYVARDLNDALAKVRALQYEEKKIILLENDLPDNY
ncbi:MAG: UDP-N-acetylmuramoyl-tripeptide--D-alanyl-D-alanine ligase [Clostridiales bacterium]|nr:UDP-N-acetylmuramoyl-tripeptide--D-alanyl-D-alanine ligase [Clostridiales bacterium]